MEKARDPGRWPLFRGFSGFRGESVPPDLLAGLTLAAIAIPEQMATAHLAGLPPRAGFFAFIAATLAFSVLGRSRRLSAGADSTITPIFAGALALLAASGSPRFAALAAGLALMTGAVVFLAGVFRMGWIGNLLSIPVTTGFLAGIAVHIAVSQVPAALGLADPGGALPVRILTLAESAPKANMTCVAIAAGVLALIAGAHRISARLPGPLAAVVLASFAAFVFRLDRQGVTLLGPVNGGAPAIGWPALGGGDFLRILPLALLVSLVVMVQTTATARSFPLAGEAEDVDSDFIGMGAGNLLAGLVGAFPVNASPPRTAIVAESGGRTPLAALTAAGVIAALLASGAGFLRFVPQAALSGVLLFVAVRIVRVKDIAEILRASPAEAAMILATAAGIVILPIEGGVALGVGLSLLNGLWSSARIRVQPMRRVAGSTIWWPIPPGNFAAEPADPGVIVLAFAAPLTFLNADAFARQFLAQAVATKERVRLAILEAAGLIEIDYTGAQALEKVVRACRDAGVDFALARLESVAAQAAFQRLGLKDLIGDDHIFASVAEAVDGRKGETGVG